MLGIWYHGILPLGLGGLHTIRGILGYQKVVGLAMLDFNYYLYIIFIVLVWFYVSLPFCL